MVETKNDAENKSENNHEIFADNPLTNISLDNVSAIVEALSKLDEHLLSFADETYNMFDFRNDVGIKRIISYLSNQLNEQERFEIMQNAN
ncbi:MULTISPECIES: hypothetical protein [unclassified Tolypothrix]|uniref:hypothetical protein n=1 Tax=unclassified Tolypothrix TaxID=2649714 RepID=UPI0005EAAEB7|nr:MULTISPECIES: hypothetical protein [unclassified Tolypothrix]BAY93309.1 hypothetical protein NIES3275_53480 [Microchaete diplosiphon NIES-3275]EKF00073.1 hypothetical protein FDUTEX481_09280 [Tolypothrix sp. PCC 7601]MBE9085542.1 hypothetical protein [Tolypothrix sp. LEGE 11397]UYD27168.1 hypothetical protein HGR01_03435 [Tolypothrix sp. PCC 7712]UYD36972.1 hypothetical protein HG267_15315 [Tolypothrix sp. PCC 7601]